MTNLSAVKPNGKHNSQQEAPPEAQQPKPSTHVRQCNYVKTSGLRCGCPALKDHYTCYFHTTAIQRRANPRSAPFPLLEDRYAIQTAIMHVIDLYSHRQISDREVSVYMKLLSLAIRNGRNLDFDSKEARAAMVTDFSFKPATAGQTAVSQPAQPKPPQPAPQPAVTSARQQPPHDSQRKVQSGGHGFSRAVQDPNVIAALAAEGPAGADKAPAIAKQLLEAAS
ncbi:MAG TPA: hypothetical protein VF753_19485 [Terriglobales bacterium]